MDSFCQVGVLPRPFAKHLSLTDQIINGHTDLNHRFSECPRAPPEHPGASQSVAERPQCLGASPEHPRTFPEHLQNTSGTHQNTPRTPPAPPEHPQNIPEHAQNSPSIPAPPQNTPRTTPKHYRNTHSNTKIPRSCTIPRRKTPLAQTKKSHRDLPGLVAKLCFDSSAT